MDYNQTNKTTKICSVSILPLQPRAMFCVHVFAWLEYHFE